MEIQFRQETCQYLRKAVSQTQTQEQTQEVRLPEAMPDIGRVLGCWGQVLVRGKEWRGNGMTVSGGVMAWVMYAPEDGSEPGSVECWIPFQLKWDFPQTQRDGFIMVEPILKSIDARSTSARKLMVRASVSAMGEALEPAEEPISISDGVPEDVQLLRKNYPIELPLESGEKLFEMEEELPLPDGVMKPEKLIRYNLIPEIMESKVMAGRLVFRGKGTVHILYRGEDGGLYTWECELPFSQYTQLDRDYSSSSDADIRVVPTSLDLEVDEAHQLRMKCAMAAQYVIHDRTMIEVVEDAYSPMRNVELEFRELNLPMRLDQRNQQLEIHGQMPCHVQRILDVYPMADYPAQRQSGDALEVTLPIQFQVLYYDENGVLQCASVRCESGCKIPSDQNNRVALRQQLTDCQVSYTPEELSVNAQCTLEIATFAEQGMQMLTGIQLGEQAEPDHNRPSLILRWADSGSLWNIAKECGTTVEAICSANQLKQDPAKGQMLLIPVP